MKRILIFSSLTLILFNFSSCATAHLDVVPQIDRTQIPPLQLPKVKLRQMEVSVTIDRKANKTAGNTPLIEGAVRDVLVDSVVRGGFVASPGSQNSLHVDLTDCLDELEDKECIKYDAKLKTEKWTVLGSGSVSDGHDRVSKAYQDALSMMIKGLERRAQDLN